MPNVGPVLSEGQVLEILTEWDSTPRPTKSALALKYNVSGQTIYNITSGTTFKELYRYHHNIPEPFVFDPKNVRELCQSDWHDIIRFMSLPENKIVYESGAPQDYIVAEIIHSKLSAADAAKKYNYDEPDGYWTMEKVIAARKGELHPGVYKWYHEVFLPILSKQPGVNPQRPW